MATSPPIFKHVDVNVAPSSRDTAGRGHFLPLACRARCRRRRLRTDDLDAADGVLSSSQMARRLSGVGVGVVVLLTTDVAVVAVVAVVEVDGVADSTSVTTLPQVAHAPGNVVSVVVAVDGTAAPQEDDL